MPLETVTLADRPQALPPKLGGTQVSRAVIACFGITVAIAGVFVESPTQSLGGLPMRLTAPLPEWVWLIGFGTLLIVLLLLGRAVFGDHFRRRKRPEDEYIIESIEPPRLSRLSLLLLLASCCGVLAGALALIWHLSQVKTTPAPMSAATGGAAGLAVLPRTGPTLPELSWPPSAYVAALVLSIVLVFILGFLAWLYWESRRRFPAGALEPLGPASGKPSAAVSDSLADLESAADSRQAILRCYGRFEQLLANSRFPRHPAHTATEFMRSVLNCLPMPPAPVRRLTLLFELSRFSSRPIGTAERDAALRSVREIRDWLRERNRER